MPMHIQPASIRRAHQSRHAATEQANAATSSVTHHAGQDVVVVAARQVVELRFERCAAGGLPVPHAQLLKRLHLHRVDLRTDGAVGVGSRVRE